mmetsp:Transcript_128375/g.369656  ORF Transcript_128375/g.369656 Transcript_128375/m.369656 type:complete len:113 (+) Transcript_128375:342-680(+)
MLPIGDQERRNLSMMQVTQKFIDSWVHDGFSDQGERTVAYGVGFFPAFRVDTRNSFGFLDHLYMSLDGLINNIMWIICLPLPFLSDWILMMTPTKDTLIGTGKTWRCFHALV